MFDTKIFQDLKGIYNWSKYELIKSQNPKKFQKEKGEIEDAVTDELLNQYELKSKSDCIQVLTSIMKYLGIQTREEEIEAMYEMMGLNGERDMSFVDIYRIFVKDEKDLSKEKEQLQEAFEFLSGDWDKLEQTMRAYDTKYVGLMDEITKEIMETGFADQEKRNSRGDKGKIKFYYKDYLDDNFK